jgi:hypothetical protein
MRGNTFGSGRDSFGSRNLRMGSELLEIVLVSLGERWEFLIMCLVLLRRRFEFPGMPLESLIMPLESLGMRVEFLDERRYSQN